MSSRTAKLAVAALGVGILVAAYRAGLFHEDPRSVAHRLVTMGPWGYLAFVGAYTVLQPFGIPGTIFVFAAPLIWPWPIAFALSMTGTMAASVVGFTFARFVARDWIAARVPERFRRYDAALAENGFRTVFVLRLVFWMPQALHAFFGVSNVRFATHFWGSLLGYVPPLLVVSFLGADVIDAEGNLSARVWPLLGVLAALSAIPFVVSRVVRRSRAPR